MRSLLARTKSGDVLGRAESGLQYFLGIPFAEQPCGPLRFKRAVPVKPWEGVFQADHYGDPAPQDNHREFTGTENCLTLNVVRPEDGEDLPVIVWIHGGGYNIGSASDPMYRGDAFAKNGIVFVSIQYRLNVLGFYDFTGMPGCEGIESNRGLSDMITAIQWIHENIAAFGGDPGRVTIAGESAGGAAVLTLMAVPAVRGCFSQVIAESGLANCVTTHELQHEYMGLFLEGMGWTEEDLPKLWTMDPLELVHGHNYLEYCLQYRFPGALEPCPVIDDLLPERPLDAIAKGSAENIRLLIGTNLHEGTMFVRPEGTTFPSNWEMVREMFRRGGHADRLEDVRAYYDDPAKAAFGSPFVHLATDYAFQEPSVQAALLQSRHGSARVYRFEYISEAGRQSGLLAAHAFELPVVFALEDGPFFEGDNREEVHALVSAMHSAWCSFIRGEDPEDWPEFTSPESPVRIFDAPVRTQALAYGEMLQVWDGLTFYRS